MENYVDTPIYNANVPTTTRVAVNKRPILASNMPAAFVVADVVVVLAELVVVDFSAPVVVPETKSSTMDSRATF